MPEKKTAPYGAWKSPVRSAAVAAGAVGLGQIRLDGEDVYWVEQRPSEAGRNVIVRCRPDGTLADVTPAPFNARTRVHEYGGGAYAVRDGHVYFSNFADQRVYVQAQTGAPRLLTRNDGLRYADAVVDAQRNRLICVREDHRHPPAEAVNTLVGIDLDSGDETVLASGSDFYSNPRLSPDGGRLTWLAWNHPNMPWDGSELWVAALDADGTPGKARCEAGGPSESIFQPEWSPLGLVYFVSDRAGWWQLYRLRNARPELLSDTPADFGRPQWVFGQSTYAFASANEIVCTYTRAGLWHMARLDPGMRRTVSVELPYTELADVQVAGQKAVFLAGSPSRPPSIVQLDLSNGTLDALRIASDLKLESASVSQPRPIAFPTEAGHTAHGLFYAPTNPDYAAPEGERPPLIVKSHGGPTSAAQTFLDPRIQFWTSRGFAVLDVNYGGSSGYGRAYRRRLTRTWGVVDVDDCVNGARSLVECGEADAERLIITGSSAGGFTTLCALTFRDTFRAGASYYGISDLEALVRDTHKFESRYPFSLVGPYPEHRDVYRARSPFHATDRLSCPLIILQGAEDKIVPPNQAERMVAALRTKRLPVAYVLFEGEQHGLRKAENIARALDAELYFYSRIFGIELADAVEPVDIEHLSDDTSTAAED